MPLSPLVVKNGSTARRSTTGLIPGPVSHTERQTAPLFARAIRNIHRNESVSSLFDFDDNEPPVKPARTGKEPARGTT